MSAAARRRHWVRLDNASNIFPAARSDVDPKVFRMSAELDHEVDPALLQDALEETFARFPLYHAVLRRGVFWYYLQDSDLHPQVEPPRSTRRTAAPCCSGCCTTAAASASRCSTPSPTAPGRCGSSRTC